MEFKYSEILPNAENPTDGLSGNIPVRRHKTPLSEDVGAIRAQCDWKRLIGPIHGFKGGLSHKYGLMQVAVPECRPERLDIIAYASEIGFLYDDCTEFLKQEELERANDEMQSTFHEGVRNGKIDSQAGGLKAMQSLLLKDMMAIDKPRALITMKVWVEFLQEAAGRQHTAEHTTFDSYMQYRILDVGEMFWFGLVTFGMALTIPPSDISFLRELTQPCWVVLALQNDFCSYSKEIKAAQEKDSSHIVNVLCVLMKEHNVNLEEAKTLCRRHIECKVAEYQSIVEAHKDDKRLSRDARIYMESLLYTLSGDAAWSLVTPRYNADQQYNKLQLSMMQSGPEATLKKLRPESDCSPSITDKCNLWSDNYVTGTPEMLAYHRYMKLAG